MCSLACGFWLVLQMELMAAKDQTGESKEAAVAAVFARMERNIELLGCTGIDDKYVRTVQSPGFRV